MSCTHHLPGWGGVSSRTFLNTMRIILTESQTPQPLLTYSSTSALVISLPRLGIFDSVDNNASRPQWLRMICMRTSISNPFSLGGRPMLTPGAGVVRCAGSSKSADACSSLHTMSCDDWPLSSASNSASARSAGQIKAVDCLRASITIGTLNAAVANCSPCRSSTSG